MLELLSEEQLNGSQLKIWRFIPPGEIPARFIRYKVASMGYDHPRNYLVPISYWRTYFRSAFDGENLPDIVDYMYFAEIDGVLGARLWFAYSPHNGIGNFGNIMTEPEYRRRGILKKLMGFFQKDFLASPAKCLSCATGNEFAAKVYMSYGFEVVYGGTRGMMSILKPELGRFTPYEKQFFDNGSNVLVRPGKLADQFAIDKFLYHSSAVREEGLAGVRHALLSDYRGCFQSQISNEGKTAVAENEKQAVTAFAYAGCFLGIDQLIFEIHPGYYKGAAEVLRKAFELNEKKPVISIQYADDAAYRKVLEEAGAALKAELAGGKVLYEMA